MKWVALLLRSIANEIITEAFVLYLGGWNRADGCYLYHTFHGFRISARGGEPEQYETSHITLPANAKIAAERFLNRFAPIFYGWFASQWISDKGTVEALDQAALKAFFYPGEERISVLARQLVCGGRSASEYTKLLRSLGIGEFLYVDSKGRPLVNCVPRVEKRRGDAK